MIKELSDEAIAKIEELNVQIRTLKVWQNRILRAEGERLGCLDGNWSFNANTYEFIQVTKPAALKGANPGEV